MFETRNRTKAQAGAAVPSLRHLASKYIGGADMQAEKRRQRQTKAQTRK